MPDLIAYKLQWRPREAGGNPGGFPPWECVYDNGGTWDPGHMPGVWGADWLIAYVTPGPGGLAAITSAMTSAGYALAHPVTAQALLTKCKQHEPYADFAQSLYIDDNGKIAGWPEPEEF